MERNPMLTQERRRIANPHFDQQRFVWDDTFSGQYEPVDYSEQFDYQWKLYLERKTGFHRHTGVETSDPWIDDRIYELTGVPAYLSRKKYKVLYPLVRGCRKLFRLDRRDTGGRLY